LSVKGYGVFSYIAQCAGVAPRSRVDALAVADSQGAARQIEEAQMKGHGLEKFADARLIATSANRPWLLLSAELLSHPSGEIGAFTPQNAEITQTIRDTRAVGTSLARYRQAIEGPR
jgi:hypothetical protein